MSRLVFGICGLKGAGKDTLGEAIASHLMRSDFFSTPGNLNFADTLKDVCALALGLETHEMHSPKFKEKTIDRWPFGTPREHLQKVGTELFRNNYPGVWVEAWKRKAAKRQGGFITTDYRFPDEGEALRSVGAKLIRVTRPGLTSDGHASEKPEALDVDIEVLNTFDTAEEFQRVAIKQLVAAGVLP